MPDDLEAARRQALESTAAEADPFATRCPGADDPPPTRGEESPSTWPDPAEGPLGPGRPRAVGPRFRVIRAHARGGIGEVFVALDSELRREVALKEIQDRHADDPRSRARFLLEAEVTGCLEHPGIVPVYALGQHADGRPYYAMRFIRGDSLKESVDRHRAAEAGRPDPAERSLALRMHLRKFVDVCNAVAYAHSRGVIHRDLKPCNVMLGPYGEALVVDWGLAKRLDRPAAADLAAANAAAADADLGAGGPHWPEPGDSCETVAGSVFGTPSYMSPEQAAGEVHRLGPAGDVYSLGATLYYVLAGRTPFEGLKVVEILDRVRGGNFPPPHAARRDVPRALEAICLKAMAREPEGRYPTAKALAEDVERWLAGASVSAYPDRLAVRLMKWCRGRPVLTTAAVACLFLDACCLVVLLLAYIERVRLAGKDLADVFTRLNVAAALLVFIPLAGQAGALLGSASGAVAGWAWRRTLAGLRRGADVGLRVGVPSAVALYLGLGALEFRPLADLTRRLSEAARPSWPSVDWPRLPDAVLDSPAWVGPGAPVDASSSFASPPADEDSAPLYLEALIEFDAGMAPCFPPAEGLRRAEIARRREALAARVDASSLDALLEEYEVGFLKLERAQRRPRCVFRAGLGSGPAPPHAAAARGAARAWAWRAGRRLELGRVDGAIDDLKSTLRLARDLRPAAPLAVQSAALAVEGVAVDEILPPILRRTDLRLDQADRLLAILLEHASAAPDPFLEGHRAEYFRLGQASNACLERLLGDGPEQGVGPGRNVLRPLLAPPTGPPIDPTREELRRLALLEKDLDEQLARTSPSKFAEATRVALDEFHRAMLDLAALPSRARIEAARRLPLERLAGRHPLLFFLLAPEGDAVLESACRAEASRNAMTCLAALRRWELAGLGEPGDLERVVQAAGMEVVPLDPFRPDGGPLRMELVEGKPVVSSVGLADKPLGDGPGGVLRFSLDPKRPTGD